MLKDLLRITDLSARDITDLIELASNLAASDALDPHSRALKGEMIVLYLTEPAPDTERTYTAAAARLGARTVTLGPDEYQHGCGATTTDLARLVSLYATVVVAVTNAIHLRQLAATATVPIVDGHIRSDDPCARIAEIVTRRSRCPALDRPWMTEAAEPDAIDLTSPHDPSHPAANRHVPHRPTGTTMLRTAHRTARPLTRDIPTTTSTCTCPPATSSHHLEHAAAAILLALHRHQLTGAPSRL